MEVLLALLIGLLFGASVYLMLGRNLIRYLFGLVLISNAANLAIFVSGGLTRAVPAIVPPGDTVPQDALANALPQALILTAIVIGFGLLAFALVLARRAHDEMRTVDTDAMRLAEPPVGDGPTANIPAESQPREAA